MRQNKTEQNNLQERANPWDKRLWENKR